MAIQEINDNDPHGGARRTAEAIVSTLRQAADVAKRNEERAKLKADGLTQELDRALHLIRVLEQRVVAAEERAAEAEGWLERVLDEAEGRLLNPLMQRAADDPPRR
jgi:hypothetical protein